MCKNISETQSVSLQKTGTLPALCPVAAVKEHAYCGCQEETQWICRELETF